VEILKSNNDLKIVLNTEQDFRTDLGWQENLMEFEQEVLNDIINPAINYETVRYIHKPYNSTISGTTINQTDIWFKFYFISGSTYVLDYNPVGITTVENELMTKQSTQSFFRLELYKTPGVISGTTLICEPPTRQNRRLVNAKNLSLPLGEKFFYTGADFGYYIHVPIFTGSNYRNKENMYLFWFDDESALTETNLSGTTTLDRYTFVNTNLTKTILFTNEKNQLTQINIPNGTTVLSGWTGQTFTLPYVTVTYDRNYYHGMNTFFMTAKFFDAKNGQVIDFTNTAFSTGHTITEQNDMYFQIDFDNFERTYQIYQYNGSKGGRIGYNTGSTVNPINFYEKGGANVISATPTPTPAPTPTPTPTVLDLNPNWQPFGDPYCEIVDYVCTSKQVWKNMNPNNGGQTEVRNATIDVCDRTEHWTDQPISDFLCYAGDKYIKQINTNPCSPTHGAQRTKPGLPYETNSNDCKVYYYYTMLPCNGVGSKIGRSNSSLRGGTIMTVQLYNCYLIQENPTNSDIVYDYDLDSTPFGTPTGCTDTNLCVAPPTFLTWNGYSQNGDYGPLSDVCNTSARGTNPWTVYTHYPDVLQTGTVIYATEQGASSQDKNQTSSTIAFAYGGHWWEVNGGTLGQQYNC
jgi:hypothetical protein